VFEVHVHAGVSIRCEFARRARDTRRTEILDRFDEVTGEGLHAAFDDEFFQERIAHLHLRLGGVVVERRGGEHRGPADTVPARAGANSTTLFPAPDAFARWMSSWRMSPTASALTSGFAW